MRKVTVNFEVTVTMDVDEGISIDEVLESMDYNFIDQTTHATIGATEIFNWTIVDSR